MVANLEQLPFDVPSKERTALPETFNGMPMLSPFNAWKILVRRTGVACGKSTFYRWVSSGKVVSFRLGQRIFIPLPEVDNIIRKCRGGERL